MTREEFEQFKALKQKQSALQQAQRAKTKDKEFKTLSTKEKDELLETACKILGLIK